MQTLRAVSLVLAVFAFAGCAHARHCRHDPSAERCGGREKCEAHMKTAPEFLNAPEAAARNLPFSEAVRAGGMLYLAGQLGTLPGKFELAPGGITAEASHALENVKGLLERNSSSMDKVVKCTVFLADMKDWPAFNTVYKTYFKAPYPARSAVGVTGLALGARTEIECIAAQ